MRIYSLIINDDTLNIEQRERAEKQEFDYEDYYEGDFRRVYFKAYGKKEDAIKDLDYLEEVGYVDWILKSWNDTPD